MADSPREDDEAAQRLPVTPLTDDELLAVTVGERLPLNGTIYLATYNPAWPSLFARLATAIHKVLGGKVLALEHVGSTAVPGLPAKPIIDILLAVADSRDEPAYVDPLEKLGYVLRIREPDWYQHRLLKAQDMAVNLHVFSAECQEIERMLLFRDWLRTHIEDRKLYEKTKRKLAAQTWKYTQNYADAKSAVVEEILARARLADRVVGVADVC